MSDTPQLRDVVVALETQYGGQFSRTPQPDGSVLAALTLTTGDRLTGSGTTTTLAVDALKTKLARMFPDTAEV